MFSLGKGFILAGIMLIAVGVFLSIFGKISWLGKLPGDILIKKEQFTFYFPLTTCLLISLVLTLLFMLWNQK